METLRLIIITTLPEKTASIFTEFMRKMADITGSKTAISYPPHITLRTGVVVPIDLLDQFIDEFSVVVNDISSFTVQTGSLITEKTLINGEETFFIGYSIEMTEKLEQLNNRLLTYKEYRKSDRTHFFPHLSIAYKDLTPEGFIAGKNWIDSNEDKVPSGMEWELDNVSLYRQENQKWIPFRVFSLSGESDMIAASGIVF